MGVFRVLVKVRNWQNRYLPPDRQGKEVECEALVDSGAAEFALPVDVIERLRLEYLGLESFVGDMMYVLAHVRIA